MKVKLIYFAWIREQIGKSEEQLELPETVNTVAELIRYLSGLGDNYAQALQFSDVIRVAINQEHVDLDTSLSGAHEIALFPPMTGG